MKKKTKAALDAQAYEEFQKSNPPPDDIREWLVDHGYDPLGPRPEEFLECLEDWCLDQIRQGADRKDVLAWLKQLDQNIRKPS